MNDIIILLFTGASVGLMSSFFGVGGGVIMIPILFSLYPTIPAHALIPISLGMISLNTALNIFNWRNDNILPSKKIAFFLFIGCVIGALVGSYSLYLMDSFLIKKVFGVVLLVVSFKMFLSSSTQPQRQQVLNPYYFIIIGLTGSFLSSITGLGGGVIYIPMFLILTRLSKNSISPYSNVSMFFAATLGLVPHLFKPINLDQLSINPFLKNYFIGHMNFFIIGIMFLGAIVTSKYGSKLNLKTSEKTKNLSLGAILLIFSIKILLY